MQATVANFQRTMGELGANAKSTKKPVKKAAPKAKAKVQGQPDPYYVDVPDVRPSPDYVRAGDVIKVTLSMKAAGTHDYSSALTGKLRDAIENEHFKVIYINDSGVGFYLGGLLMVEVQAPGDFNAVRDVAKLLNGLADSTGYRVASDGTFPKAEFVAKVNDKGQLPKTSLPVVKKSKGSTSPVPSDNFNSSPAASDKSAWEQLFGTSTPQGTHDSGGSWFGGFDLLGIHVPGLLILGVGGLLAVKVLKPTP